MFASKELIKGKYLKEKHFLSIIDWDILTESTIAMELEDPVETKDISDTDWLI